LNIKEIVKKYGTPLYIYNLQEINDSFQALKNALPDQSIIYYSLKANPHPELVERLIELGCHAEVSSIGEAEVISQKEIDPELCIYTGPGKSRKELEIALKQGISLYSVESLNELVRLSELTTKLSIQVKVILRVNPSHTISNSGLKMTGVPSQFGIDEDTLVEQFRNVKVSKFVNIIGFHIFIGSNIPSVDLLLINFKKSIDVAKRLATALNIKLHLIDLGGGFGAFFAKNAKRNDYTNLKEPLESYLDEQFPNWKQGNPNIAFESGRYLVASCGYFISSVEDIKISRDTKYIILDSGIHHLSGMTGLGRIPKVEMDFLFQTRGTSDFPPEKVTITGPLCTPLDFFIRDGECPPLQLGDQLIVSNVGAYGITASLLGFLSREAPLEVVYEGNKVKKVSRLSLNRIEGEI
jgi:diaminopimelate decarboxylase